MRKHYLIGGLTVLASVAMSACGGVSAEDGGGSEFPEGTIELVVPFDAGGSTDLITRAFAKELEKNLDNATVVVINRPGASTAVGAAEVAKAKPDGHKLFIGTTTTFVTTPMAQAVPYSVDDFEGIVGIADQSYMVVTAPDSPYQSLDDLANGSGRITYGVTAVGNNTHLAMGDFLKKSGVTAEAVPFESAQEALVAAAGGQVDIATVDLSVATPQEEGGNVRALGVTAAERVEQAPNVPTLVESGVETQPFVGRWALVGPDGMPEEVVQALEEASLETLESESFQQFRNENFLSEPEYADGTAWLEEMVPAVRETTEHLFDELKISQG